MNVAWMRVPKCLLNLPFLPRKEGPMSIGGGMSVAVFPLMGWICEHCGVPFERPAYRVKSEESGEILLNMIVCHCCCTQAQELGLHTEKIDLESLLNTEGRKKDIS